MTMHVMTMTWHGYDGYMQVLPWQQLSYLISADVNTKRKIKLYYLKQINHNELTTLIFKIKSWLPYR